MRRRHGGNQSARIGMLRGRVDRVLFGNFHNFAKIHHRDTVRDMPHHRKIMSDEQIGQPHIALQILQQIDDLRLDGNIKRRDRLITHNKARAQDQRTRNADALTLAARKFMRKAIQRAAWQANTVQHFSDLLACLGAGFSAMDHHRFSDDILDSHARIERAIGVLENDLHGPAKFTHRRAAKPRDFLPLKADIACGGVKQPDQQPPKGGFAAA